MMTDAIVFGSAVGTGAAIGAVIGIVAGYFICKALGLR